MIAGFFLHLVHWKVNTALGLLAYLAFNLSIGLVARFLKLDFDGRAAFRGWWLGSEAAIECGDSGDTIGEFEARIQNQGDTTQGLPIHIQIENQRLRIWAGADRLGSWPLEEVAVERLTPFRFRVMVEGDPMIVVPEDPTGFASATNAFIDARAPRFGLASRIQSHRESSR